MEDQKTPVDISLIEIIQEYAEIKEKERLAYNKFMDRFIPYFESLDTPYGMAIPYFVRGAIESFLYAYANDKEDPSKVYMPIMLMRGTSIGMAKECLEKLFFIKNIQISNKGLLIPEFDFNALDVVKFDKP